MKLLTHQAEVYDAHIADIPAASRTNKPTA
jgi:hypothetical protein